MSFKSVFEVDGNSYRVLKCNFALNQDIDNTGRPSSVARGGVVNIVIESTDDTSLFEWMCDSYMKKDAKITFNKRDEDAKMKDLEIIEAYMVNYEESFDDSGAGAMLEKFSLSARSLRLGNGEHENEWAI